MSRDAASRPAGLDEDAVLRLCLAMPGAWPDSPWGDGVVAKVGGPPGKVFAFPGGGAVALKATPEDGAELRAAYADAVGDAPYLSKRHWVRIVLDGTVPDDELRALLQQSHALVVRGLPRAQRPHCWTLGLAVGLVTACRGTPVPSVHRQAEPALRGPV